MNEIKVTTELCAEDRARLDRLIAALEHVGTPYAAPVAAEPEKPAKKAPAETKQAETQPQPDPVKNEAETTTAPAKEEAPAVTLEQIQQKVIQLAAAGSGEKKAQVRAIINAHAAKVSDLPQDKWADVWQQLTELEGVNQ